jgi:hypothetical protein
MAISRMPQGLVRRRLPDDRAPLQEFSVQRIRIVYVQIGEIAMVAIAALFPRRMSAGIFSRR